MHICTQQVIIFFKEFSDVPVDGMGWKVEVKGKERKGKASNCKVESIANSLIAADG